MTVAESGDIRLEAAGHELRIHAPRPASVWPKKRLADARWWRLLRELEHLGTPAAIGYDRFSGLLHEGFRFPLLFGGWSPLTMVVDERTPVRYRMGRIDVEVERQGRYLRLASGGPVWLLDEPSWRLLETAPEDAALRRALAVEANAELCGELARTEIVYSAEASKRYATRSGWVEQRHVEGWSGSVIPLCGRLGLRDGLPVKLGDTGRVLRHADYSGSEEPGVRTAWLADARRAELLALIACSFVWRGFHAVLPADGCWMGDCVVALRHGEATAVWLADSCDAETLRQVHFGTARLRRLCPGEYTAGLVVRGPCPRAAKEAGARKGIRVRDRYELANLAAADAIPEAAVAWALAARCASPGETVEKLREARMVP